jgi:hypothetical protein
MSFRVKRKRSASSIRAEAEAAARVAELPPESIDPLSHGENTRQQFKIAGWPESKPLPANIVTEFPHKPWLSSDVGVPAAFANQDKERARRASSHAISNAEVGEGDENSLHYHGPERYRQFHDQALGSLAAVIKRSLHDGNIPRAKKAFGLLLRSDVRARPVDLRLNGYWALGVEVLMRDGEVDLPTARRTGDGEKTRSRENHQSNGGADHDRQEQKPGQARWGRAENMPQVRRYFESLIRIYPYDHRRPRAISAVEFWSALLSCELYNAWTEYQTKLSALSIGQSDEVIPGRRRRAEAGDEDEEVDSTDGLSEQETLLRLDKIRRDAQKGVTDIARTMDELMSAVPYTSHVELLRLRGMVALYMSDLALPAQLRSAAEEQEANLTRTSERRRAAASFRKMLERGGEPDRIILAVLRDDDGLEDRSEDISVGLRASLPMFTSMSAQIR